MNELSSIIRNEIIRENACPFDFGHEMLEILKSENL